jgi:hypothetical protein
LTTGCTYYVQVLTSLAEPSVINDGPYKTLPEARDGVEKVDKRLRKLPESMGANRILIVKVMETRHRGAKP